MTTLLEYPGVKELKAQRNILGLIKLLEGENVEAARALGELKEPFAIIPIMKILRKSKDINNIEFKKEIINTLGEIGDISSVECLRELLIKEYYSEVRDVIIKNIKKIDTANDIIYL